MICGKERDAESNLDYFGARYYSGAQGRFTTPDWSAMPTPVPYARLDDPQTLNLYSYVRNNPLSITDPDGHGFWRKLANKFKYGHFVEDDQLENALSEDTYEMRSWLMNNVAADGSERQILKGMSNINIFNIFEQWNSAIQAIMPGEVKPSAFDFKRASNGDLVFYRGGELQATIEDVKIDRTSGLLNNTHGVLLHIDPSKLSRFGHVHQILLIHPELRIIQRGKDPCHYEITPLHSGTMSFERLNQLLREVVTKLLGPG